MPHSHVVTALSPAEPDAVFATLVRADTWPSWSPIDRAEVANPGQPQQVGDIRIFHTGRAVSHERTVDLAPAPRGGTSITWSAEFVPKLPLTGRFWCWYLARFMRRTVEGLAAYAR